MLFDLNSNEYSMIEKKISKDYIGFKTIHLLLPPLHKRIATGEKKEEQYMNKKTVMISLLLALIILTGAPTSFAKEQYLNNLTEVYGPAGSCDTCHSNGSADGPRTDYGMLFEKQSNHAANASAALIAIGAPPESSAATPTIAMTATPVKVTPEITEENPEDEDIPVNEEIPEETTPRTTEEAKGSPGFGFVASLVGLFAWALIAKRNNK
jgi:hypothetical protein